VVTLSYFERKLVTPFEETSFSIMICFYFGRLWLLVAVNCCAYTMELNIIKMHLIAPGKVTTLWGGHLHLAFLHDLTA
jgi:hypothetical protein